MKYTDKEQTIAYLVLILVFAIGLYLGRFSVSQEITKQDLNNFKAGYNDGMINKVTELIAFCTGDVNVFRGTDINDKQWGLMYVCNSNNDTMIVKYSGRNNGS